MRAAEYIFWTSLALLVFTFFGYPVLLFVVATVVQVWRDLAFAMFRRDRRKPRYRDDELPAVTVICPAFNEEERLPAKFMSMSRHDYPRDRYRRIFISDGSTDGTNALLRGVEDERTKVIYLEQRSGKPNALNTAIAAADTDIVVFTDASTLFRPDTVRNLVRHFADPRVGAACGALDFEGTAESSSTEGIYWTFENFLRMYEGRLGATLTASGAVFAMRKECYVPLRPGTILDDFVLPMEARGKGYRVVYDPEARATEFAAKNILGEFVRRTRLASGSFGTLGVFLRMSLPPMTALAFICHKLLRWFAPFFLLALLLSNLALFRMKPYNEVLALQAVFYLWAGLGFLLRNRSRSPRYALTGYFFLAMQLAFILGFIRFLQRRDIVTWQRVS